METQTPSLDILREYENRFVPDPELEKESRKTKKSRRKFKKSQFLGHENFASHTISSAIKADYTLPDVRQKLEELNRSVQKAKIVKTAPGVKSANIFRSRSFRPFVVRKADEYGILRKPESHDVLHDGLVLTKKSPMRIFAAKMSRSRPVSRSRSVQSRMTRSLSPIGFNRSLNENLAIENYRPLSRKSSQRELKDENLGYSFTSFKNSSGTLDHDIMDEIQSRASRLNMNSDSIFNRTRSPFNQTTRLNSNDLTRASFLEQYENKSFKKAHHATQKLIAKDKKCHKYPKNESMSNYSPPIDWQYSRYYPWLFNYTEYLRNLEEELYWLKQRSKNLRVY